MDAPTGRTALLVDDNRLDHLNTRGLLLGSGAGFTRLEWLDHWPGVEVALAKGPFDLFLVDMHLGPNSGLDVIRALRGAGVLEPIIALTGQADEQIDRACTDAGASDFLVKGEVNRSALERSIRYADRQVAVHRELERLNAALERRATAEGEQAALMRLAIEQSTDPIALTKAGATIADQPLIYVNAAFSRLIERRMGDLLGMDVGALFADDTAAPGGALDRTIALRASYLDRVALAGASRPVRVTLRATPLRATDEAAGHYVWTCRDIADADVGTSPSTPRYEAIGRIAAGVAHALNDRLTALLGHLEILAAKTTDPAARRPLDKALSAAEDLAGQAHLLATIARPAAEQPPDVVDLGATVDAAMPLLRHAAGGLVTLERRDDGPATTATVDPARLEIALIALVDVIGRSLPQGGALEIGIDDDASLVIRGAGSAGAVPTEDVERVEALVRHAGGTLAIARSDGTAAATVRFPNASG